MRFIAFGHPNIRSTHATTLEFTKDKELTPRGDCIVGVGADYSLEEIKKLLKQDTLALTMKVDNLEETIHFTPNKDFNDDKELVIRKTDFKSERTLGIYADKAAKDLTKELIIKLQDKNTIIQVIIQ